jgi:hypothetical protein
MNDRVCDIKIWGNTQQGMRRVLCAVESKYTHMQLSVWRHWNVTHTYAGAGGWQNRNDNNKHTSAKELNEREEIT